MDVLLKPVLEMMEDDGFESFIFIFCSIEGRDLLSRLLHRHRPGMLDKRVSQSWSS